MPIDYVQLKAWPFADAVQRYSEKDTMLYSLALGLGQDPLDESRLRFVYEKRLRALPTMAVVLGWPGFWMQDPNTGIDWKRLLNGEQRVRFYRELPVAGTVVGRTRVGSITDKGADKGAIVVTQRTLCDAATGELLASIEQSTFCRGDGGYSARGQPTDPAPRALAMVPVRPPDQIFEIATRPESALIYRLCADPNPLHAEPAIARAAGFDRPILHGLATFGIAGYAVLHTFCGGEPARLRSLACRFSAPVFPGDLLSVEMWSEPGQVQFRAICRQRAVEVVTHGMAEIGDQT